MSWATDEAELSERLPAPPAASTDVVVAVFTFTLVHCASAAAREHLATSAPLTVTARVVKRSRRRSAVVALSPSIGYSTGPPCATHRIEHFQFTRHADRHAVQNRTGHRHQNFSEFALRDASLRLGTFMPKEFETITRTNQRQSCGTQTKRRPRISPKPSSTCNVSG